MSKRVWRNWAFIHLLIDTSSTKQRKSVVSEATSEQIKTLAEIIANILAGSLPITAAAKKKFSRVKNALRSISQSKVSVLERKRLIINNLSYIVKLLCYVKPALKLMKP